MGSIYEALLLLTALQWQSPGKALAKSLKLPAEIAVFFMEHQFYLNEHQQINYGYSE
jgi:hypothetical protein